MTLIILFILLLCRFSNTHSLSTEGIALLSLKPSASAAIDFSAFLNWNEFDSDPCHWNGITCSVISKHFPPSVISISLPVQNLSGEIPVVLSSLMNLRRINLRGNNLSGSIPEELFSNSSALRSVFLHDNNLSGRLPLSICTVPRLQNLDLSNNSLTGEIAGNFKFCKKLQRLILAGNGLTGEIPAGIWSEMKSLGTLDLSDNELSGSIPEEIGEVSSLAGELNLSGNQFTGNIPDSLTKLPITVKIDFRNNNLTGKIPHFNMQQDATAFENNPMLCGFPLHKSCEETITRIKNSHNGLEVFNIALIVAAHFIAVACLATGAIYICKKQRRAPTSSKCVCLRRRRTSNETRSQASASHCSCIRAHEGLSDADSVKDEVFSSYDDDENAGKLVAIDKEFNYDIDELFRASAYVLGMNARGIVYKVVVGNGVPLVVRRLGSGSGGGEYKEFTADVIVPNDQPPFTTNESSCYAAPESMNPSEKPTQKWDVYSFGVILLQLLTGRNPEVSQSTSDDLSLAKWVRKGVQQRKTFSSVIDPMLSNDVTFQKDAPAVLQLALACTDDDPELRPKMKLVSENLRLLL